MNDRIKELVTQAEEDAYYGGAVFGERLAELIVRECMNICAECEEDIRTRIKDEGKAATAYMCRAHIKEHFGIDQNEPAKPLTYVEWFIRSPDITPEVIEDVKYMFGFDDKEAKEYVLRKEYEFYLSNHK